MCKNKEYFANSTQKAQKKHIIHKKKDVFANLLVLFLYFCTSLMRFLHVNLTFSLSVQIGCTIGF